VTTGTGAKWAVVAIGHGSPLGTGHIVVDTFTLDIEKHLNHGTLPTSGPTIHTDTNPQVGDTQLLFRGDAEPQRHKYMFRGNAANGTQALMMEVGESYCYAGATDEHYAIGGGRIVEFAAWVPRAGTVWASGNCTLTLEYGSRADMEADGDVGNWMPLGPGFDLTPGAPAKWFKSLDIPLEPDWVLGIQMNFYSTLFNPQSVVYAEVTIEDRGRHWVPVPESEIVLLHTFIDDNRFTGNASLVVYPVSRMEPST